MADSEPRPRVYQERARSLGPLKQVRRMSSSWPHSNPGRGHSTSLASVPVQCAPSRVMGVRPKMLSESSVCTMG